VKVAVNMVLPRFWSLGKTFFELCVGTLDNPFGPLNNGLLPLTKWEYMKVKKGFKKKVK
jgi:hypothetical protein